MTRLLEIIVALILVFVLAVVVGVLLPSHGHVERSIEISHNLRHTFDSLNSFRRFPDYSAVRALDPNAQFSLSGPDEGAGSEVSWQKSGNSAKGDLTITSSEEDRQVIWSLKNGWRGANKRYTIDLVPSENHKLVKINMSYDVDYGWDLMSRYSQLYLHGDPATFMQYTLNSLQSMLANIPNIGYKDLDPVLVDTEQKPVMIVSTQAPRNLDDIAVATSKALDQIHAAMKKVGVEQAGHYVTLTTDWGAENYSFDIAVPIDSTKLKFGSKVVDLRDAPKPKSLAEQNLAANAEAEKAAAASSTAGAGSGADVQGSDSRNGPGTFSDDGTLAVTEDVNAELAFGGRALMATWNGSPAGLSLMRLALKAYAGTHGYDFNEYSDRLYDIDVSAEDNNTEDDRNYRVYLPVSNAPEKTPWQMKNPEKAEQVISGSSVAAPASASSVDPGDASSVTQPSIKSR
ncbi:MAG: polyketide cyclase [Rhodanobacteraceae bacterium]